MPPSSNLVSELGKEQSSIEPIEASAEHFNVGAKDIDHASKGSSSDDNGIAVQANGHGVPKLVGGATEEEQEVENRGPKGRHEWFAYIKTKQFWLVLLFGYVCHCS